MESIDQDLLDFSGITRLFPLPHFVMFPHIKKVFHIFEPRYIRMVLDALVSDRYITMATLQPDAAIDAAKPMLFPTGCLTLIEQHQALADGKFNILLRGICRVHITQEMLTSTPYRVAQVEPMLDVSTSPSAALRQELIQSIATCVTGAGAFAQEIQHLLKGDMPLASLTDYVAFFLPLSITQKQQLLLNQDVAQRVRLLIELMQQLDFGVDQPELMPPPRARRFPPDFSVN